MMLMNLRFCRHNQSLKKQTLRNKSTRPPSSVKPPFTPSSDISSLLLATSNYPTPLSSFTRKRHKSPIPNPLYIDSRRQAQLQTHAFSYTCPPPPREIQNRAKCASTTASTTKNATTSVSTSTSSAIPSSTNSTASTTQSSAKPTTSRLIFRPVVSHGHASFAGRWIRDFGGGRRMLCSG